jgi:integrase
MDHARARESAHLVLFHVAPTSGLRRGELLALRWQDVDLDDRVLRVRRTLNQVDGELTFGKPKSKRSRRDVGLDDETASLLRLHRKEQHELRLLVGSGWRNHDLVFASPTGEPWKPDSITRAFARLVESSGLPRLSFHGLRHVHASMLIASGTNARVVSERLGHSSVSFTLSVYVQALDGQQHDAAERVAALIAAPSKRARAR